ncbi:hypothetical protein JM93_03153 [Roseibium hamelinense]|uniref:Uncharacterized protein n=1 Tax=Roseibium hamelinense TaxID=150831 RepID=A0A562STY4_9HYPH|nr:hypothetical protein [Roseibium hamelinense]MTI42541.1 hypothetical protein [Roseibium hamelinense]TWI84817.1 hypothetical protein JM93_03153 [Roseibium hamelinense]
MNTQTIALSGGNELIVEINEHKDGLGATTVQYIKFRDGTLGTKTCTCSCAKDTASTTCDSSSTSPVCDCTGSSCTISC